MERKVQEISNGVNEELKIPESQRIAEKIKAEDLKRKLDIIKQKDRLVIHNKIFAFVDDLRKKFKGEDKVLRNYSLFHILVGSTYEEDDCEFFDFSGNDSVEKFIVGLEEEKAIEDDKKKKS